MLPKSGTRLSENGMLNSLQSITFVPLIDSLKAP
jgi:hypothetical protein